jgi:hypothetical protein
MSRKTSSKGSRKPFTEERKQKAREKARENAKVYWTQERREEVGRKLAEARNRPNTLAQHIRRWATKTETVEQPAPLPTPALKSTAGKLSRNCYRIVPKSIPENVAFRLFACTEAAHDVEVQALLMEWCRADIHFWFNTFVWSLDTRKVAGKSANTTTPFVTFDAQDESITTILEAIVPSRGGRQWKVLIEKTRDMGATWICAMVFLYLWLFHPDRLTFLMLSFREEEVDGGDSTIFDKIDFAMKHMPSWMLPNCTRTYMTLVNDDTGSSINGQATTAKAGVSKRYTAMFFDEFPLVADDRTIYMKTADCSNCRIFNGTPNGRHTQFYEMTKWGENEGFKKVRLHWTSHAEKRRGLWKWDKLKRKAIVLDKIFQFPPGYKFDNPIVREKGGVGSIWYDRECRERGYNRLAIAQELDIDYHTSGDQFFDHEEIVRLIDAYTSPPLHTGVMTKEGFLDRPDGHLKLWFRVPKGGRPAMGRYAIGCDVSQGSDGKYATASCASITNMDTGEKVAELTDARLRPEQFAKVASELAEWFHGARVVWEHHGPGVTFARVLMNDYRYVNVYFRKKNETSAFAKQSSEPGWTAAPAAQLELMESYRAALSSGKFCNRSAPALEELQHFVYDGNTVKHSNQKVKDAPGVATVNHGDMGWADALSWLLVREGGGAVMQRDLPAGQEGQRKAPVGSPAWWREQDEREADNDGWGSD